MPADLRQRGEELAPEDFAEVVRFLVQRPELELGAGAPGLDVEIDPARVVARDRGDNGALNGRVPVHLRARNDVLRVPVMALVVDELSGVAQQSGGGEPVFVFRGKLVEGLQLAE